MTPTGPIAAEPLEDVAEAVDRQLDRHDWVETLLRLGWIAKSVVYAGMAWVAFLIAFRRPTASEASYTGAIQELAIRPLSRLSLILLGLGLVMYVAWRFASVLLLGNNDADDWAHRIGYGFSAVTYSVFAYVSLRTAFEGLGPDDESVVETVSKGLLDSGLGRIGVGLGGLAAIGVAIYFAVKGLDKRFRSNLKFGDATPTMRWLVETTGAIGWFGRCLSVAVVGAFITWSAIDADPGDARGLDSSITRLAGDDLGVGLVVLIASLLAVYAAFCLLSLPYRCLEKS